MASGLPDFRGSEGFYGHRLALYRHTQPHAGFALLRRAPAPGPGRVGEPDVAAAFGVGLACGAVEVLTALDERLGAG